MKIDLNIPITMYLLQHGTNLILLHFAVKTWVSGSMHACVHEHAHTHTRTQHRKLHEALGLITPSVLIITSI